MEIINFVAFNADVWGTVSDWIIVIVTSSTAIYLVKNLFPLSIALMSHILVKY
ncbi:hypothetical protein [Pedobacter cryoconitis]|uniref:hypothetical protein n=1 Tax=Pedobacter cryoconitis TaxID=188932 RepID=UPI0016089363|nr:hypothetical protein [Pedobacter cryoconitis]MBB5643944.1 hypothetical protein [Pedobacter cryoconitis]